MEDRWGQEIGGNRKTPEHESLKSGLTEGHEGLNIKKLRSFQLRQKLMCHPEAIWGSPVV